MSERATFLASLTPAEVRAEAAALEAQAARLRRMADAMDEPDHAGPVTGGDTRTQRPVRRRSRSSKKPPTSKRPAILAAMRMRPDSAWSPKEIFEALVERGDVDPEQTSMENVRVAIHRMARGDELRKLGDGAYALPSPNGTPPTLPMPEEEESL
jgi:hypothetical protein